MDGLLLLIVLLVLVLVLGLGLVLQNVPAILHVLSIFPVHMYPG
jgi:threonine/homoserine/homoserine lactone efflux protein